MSEKQTIEAEFVSLCQKAGEVQYRIKLLKAELAQLNQKMLEINQKAAALAGAPAPEAVQESDAQPEPVSPATI